MSKFDANLIPDEVAMSAAVVLMIQQRNDDEMQQSKRIRSCEREGFGALYADLFPNVYEIGKSNECSSCDIRFFMLYLRFSPRAFETILNGIALTLDGCRRRRRKDEITCRKALSVTLYYLSRCKSRYALIKTNGVKC